jgi:RNA polymerase sigma factor (sigma-70 family)
VKVDTGLIEAARSGDQDAFHRLVGPYQRELHQHCYRILGSVADAEDALQETLLAAWRGLAGFEGRASIRTWLYRIATTRSLNMLRSASRRPAVNLPGLEPVPTPWEPELYETMRTTGRAIYEETVADQLLADLSG